MFDAGAGMGGGGVQVVISQAKMEHSLKELSTVSFRL